MYAVVFKSKEARSERGEVVTPEGTLMLLLEEPEGWVAATSGKLFPGELAAVQQRRGQLNRRAKVFDSPEAAAEFMKAWQPHPWYADPIPGSWELVPVEREVKIIEETIGWRVLA